MDIIVTLYEHLATKLEGSRGPVHKRKYTPQSVVQAKDLLHLELESVLRDLQGRIAENIEAADEIIDTANLLGGLLTNSQNTLYQDKQAQKTVGPRWIALLSEALTWDSLSRIQSENIKRDIELLDRALAATERTKEGLVVLSVQLVRFEEAVESARRRNDRSVLLGLDAEDLLRSYRESLVASRREIDGWS